MQLVDRQRCSDFVAPCPRLQPLLVIPFELQWRSDLRRGIGRQCGGQGHRIAFQRQNPVSTENLVLIDLAGLQTRDENLPYAGRVAHAHGMATSIPAVEAANHRNTTRIGCPDRKTHTVHAIDAGDLRAQTAAQVAMITLGKQVKVHLAQQRAKAVRVFGDLFTASPIDFQQVRLRVLEVANEKPRHFAHFHLAQFTTVIPGQQTDTQRCGQVGADVLPAAAITMRAEDRERVTVFSTDQRVEVHSSGNRAAARAGFVRRIHIDSPSDGCSNPRKPCKGTASQAGRFSAS